MTIDNDLTKGLAAPFLILAHVRTGGTFLAHALSTHPQIFCDRGETFHRLSAWRQAEVSVSQIMRVIWQQDGYHAAGFRAIYRQAFHAEVWPGVLTVKPRIIHLTRENVTRQGVSFAYQQLVRQGKLPFYAVHSFQEAPALQPVTVEPAVIVDYVLKVSREMDQAVERLAGYPGPVLRLTYEELTGNKQQTRLEPRIADRIGEFLGVGGCLLPVSLKRDFSGPMSGWFANWPDICQALQAAGFAGLTG